MDLTNLDDSIRKKLLGRATRFGKGKLSDDLIEDTRQLIQTETGNDITTQKMKNILSSLNTWQQDAFDIFNSESGLVSNFVIDGRSVSDIVIGTDKFTSSHLRKLREQVIPAVNNAKKITVSYGAIENREQLISQLKEAIAQDKVGNIDTPLLSNEEKDTMKKLLDVLNKITGEDAEEAQKITFDTLTKLERSLVNVSVLPEKARKEYYEYWEGIQEKFDDFANVINATDSLTTDILEAFRERGVDAGAAEPRDDNPYAQTIRRLTEQAYLPSYIIQVSHISIEDEGDEKMAVRLVQDFLKTVGKELSVEQKKLTGDDAAGLIAQTAREDFDAETGRGTPSIDPTAADDLADEIEEQEIRARRLLTKKYVDPLFSILVKNNDIAGEFSSEIVANAKSQIKEKLDYSNLGIFAEEVENLVDDVIDKFLDKFESSMSVVKERQSTFDIPMMDSQQVISHFDSTDGSFKVYYYRNGALTNRTFNKYSDAVEFINEGTKRFFEQIGIIIELQAGASPLVNKPRMPKFGTKRKTSSTPYQYLGGITKPLAYKLPQASLDKIKSIQPIIDLIQDYYIKPLTGNMILLEDVPEFYSSQEFKDFPTLFSGSNVNQARKAIIQGANPVVEKQDFVALNRFLARISQPDSLVYSEGLLSLFEKSLDAYVKFWANADAVVNNTEPKLPKIVSDAEIVFGDSLYEIASATLSQQEVEDLVFEGESLSYWNKKQAEEDTTIESLLVLLESDEWKTFIENSSIVGIKSENRKLIDKLKESDIKLTGPITHAMLQATDMLRKMKGKNIYVSNLDPSDIDDISYVIDLVAKEDNIDIYGIDIYNILKSQSSFNDIANENRLSTEIVYKVKGLFR